MVSQRLSVVHKWDENSMRARQEGGGENTYLPTVSLLYLNANYFASVTAYSLWVFSTVNISALGGGEQTRAGDTQRLCLPCPAEIRAALAWDGSLARTAIDLISISRFCTTHHTRLAKHRRSGSLEAVLILVFIPSAFLASSQLRFPWAINLVRITSSNWYSLFDSMMIPLRGKSLPSEEEDEEEAFICYLYSTAEWNSFCRISQLVGKSAVRVQ